MSLWSRAPREVYRVYGEDQYREGETAPEGETVAPEDPMLAEPDGRAGASWVTFVAETPPTSLGAADGSSAPPSGLRAGRLIGVGLLVGVGLATLALVLLNMAHRRGAAPERVGEGIRVEAEQGRGRVAGAGRAQVVTHSVNSAPVQSPRFSASPVRTPIRVSASTLRPRAPMGGGSDTASRPRRAWPAALRAPANGVLAMVAVEPSRSAVVESPAQDEFGFEQ
jgi:hypothetical protein